MVYECDHCSAALPAGVNACPYCAEEFDEAVPADAVLPKAGFTALSPAVAAPDEQIALSAKLEQAESGITVLKEQAIVLKCEVMTLRGHVSTLTGEVTALEGQTTSQTSQISLLLREVKGLEGHITSLTNRLTVAEMAGREDKRRFMDHVKHMREALGSMQLNGPAGAAGS